MDLESMIGACWRRFLTRHRRAAACGLLCDPFANFLTVTRNTGQEGTMPLLGCWTRA